MLVNIFTYKIWWRACVCTKLWKTHTTRNIWSSMSRGPKNNITALRKANLSPSLSQYFNANGSLWTHFLPTQSFSTPMIFLSKNFSKKNFLKKKYLWPRNRIYLKLLCKINIYIAYFYIKKKIIYSNWLLNYK